VAAPHSPVFLGRTSEQGQLSRLLDKVRAGESAALVVRGEAGIGKTALMDHWAQQASDFPVVRIAGIQSEMELPFAGLHQLCAPMLANIDSLPDPQQNALGVAFGLTSGNAPDRFLVALATLSLLAEVARRRPLLCLVDDAHWLDAASAQVLGFVARRILAESVLMLFAIREPTEDRYLLGLPELTLHGLSDDEARGLLIAATPGPFDPQVRNRIVAETLGNPLALLELPKGMTAAELAGGFPIPHSRDLPGQIEDRFQRRLEALPEATQRLMLLASADPTGDAALLWRAAQTLGVGRDAAEVPDAEQLVEIGATVRFRHPLVRSAIYSGAASEDQRAVHLALAGAMDPQTDPDRRAWHRALAAAGPDEEVAIELERSASRAQSRGGLAAAAAFLDRSAQLTPDRARRAERTLTAAQATFQTGAFDTSLRLLNAAETGALDELQSARVDLLRGQIAFASNLGSDAPMLLLKAAKRLEPLDVTLARETYLQAWGAALFAGGSARRGGSVLEVSQAALAAPRAEGAPGLSDLVLDALALLGAEGLSAAAPALREALSEVLGALASTDELRWGWLLIVLPDALWDFEGWGAIHRRMNQLARDAGALAVLPITLSSEAFHHVWAGEFREASSLIAEAQAIADATGARIPPYAALQLAALRGMGQEASTLIETTSNRARAGGQGIEVQLTQWVTAILYNGLARYQEALVPARQASEDTADLYISSWALPELVEAATRSGDTELAADALERFGKVAAACGTDWAIGIEERSRALLNTGEVAEDAYRAAIERLGRTRLRPDLARTHLLYGEWLRRQGRRADARLQLRRAYDMFSEIGMLAFGERALGELRATGETVRKRRDDTRNDLTPQEEQIARLALEGRSNPEIGAQLFISGRTVEWHLGKVFAKLGITSRRGLNDAVFARLGIGTRT
jgi:DNA-binding CsgD family transcriptional regulator